MPISRCEIYSFFTFTSDSSDKSLSRVGNGWCSFCKAQFKGLWYFVHFHCFWRDIGTLLDRDATGDIASFGLRLTLPAYFSVDH